MNLKKRLMYAVVLGIVFTFIGYPVGTDVEFETLNAVEAGFWFGVLLANIGCAYVVVYVLERLFFKKRKGSGGS